ncbi:MAG: DUF6017 domain-containing protein [Oscillospiraceae bacterium]
MDYLGSIIAFEKWLDRNHLEPAPQLLMYKLFKLADADGWPEWLPVENLDLMALVKTKREATVIAWRDRLLEKGLLDYRKGKKGSPNKYRFAPFLAGNTTDRVAQMVVKSVAHPVAQAVANTADIVVKKSDIDDRQTDEDIIFRLSELSNILACIEVERLEPPEWRVQIPEYVAGMWYAEHVRVGKQNIPQAQVRQRLSQLDRETVQFALTRMQDAGKIGNIRGYMMACLYNAPVDYDASLNARIAKEAKF